MRIGDHSADPDPQEAGRAGDGSLHPGDRHRSGRGSRLLLHSDQIHPVSDSIVVIAQTMIITVINIVKIIQISQFDHLSSFMIMDHHL